MTEFRCPSCEDHLGPVEGESIYRCMECGLEMQAKIARNADWLTELAESDLSCAWIAEELLGIR